MENNIRINYSQNKTDINRFKRATKIIIDCDPGVDDTSAIVLALDLCKQHNVEILAFTVADGNAPIDQVALNIQLLLRICGRSEIPIYKGDARVSNDYAFFFHGEDGFGGLYNEYN